MALAPNESWRGGFVWANATGRIATTTNVIGAKWSGGFLRDPDGRLVVTLR